MARAALGVGVLVFAAFAVACGSEEKADSIDLPPSEKPAPAPKKKAAPPPAEPVCDAQEASYEPTRPKANILFALDRSGSMKIKLPTGKTRWAATRDSLFSLIDSLSSTTARASVMQFPQGDEPLNSCCKIDANNAVDCNCSSYPAPTDRCDAGKYQAEAPMDLDAAAIASIKESVNASNADFYWGTPLAAAESAAVKLQQSSANDGVKTVVLLTDGAPTSCDTKENPTANDPSFIIEAAKAGVEGSEKIRTYVIGVVDGKNGNDARPDILSQVAQAGGSARGAGCEADNSCFYSVSAMQLEQDLAAALAQIAKEATDCTFDLPAAADADPSKVNVTIATSSGTETIGRDAAQTDGWDYEGTSRIKLFGAACKAVQEDEAAKVNVVVGCATVTAP